jgi:hypothetical protein
MKAARRFAMLHVFVRAGRALVSRLARGGKGGAATQASRAQPPQGSKLPAPIRPAPQASKLPPPVRPTRGRGDEPPRELHPR